MLLPENGLWKGLDLSGITVLVGAGMGGLVGLIREQVSAASGQLLVVADRLPAAKEALARADAGSISVSVARVTHLPFMEDSIDLLVLNGVLRDVPVDSLPAIAQQMWRTLAPGGRFRIADVIDPGEEEPHRAWAERNRIVLRLATALGRRAGVAIDLRATARALANAGFDQLTLTLLPGYPLNTTWLEDTVEAVRSMVSTVADPVCRHQVMDIQVPRLIRAFSGGQQTGPSRAVISGAKPGGLADSMTASFSEADLHTPG